MATYRSSRRPSPEVSRRPPRSNVSVRIGDIGLELSPAQGLGKKLQHSRSFFPSAIIDGVSRWFRSYGFADVYDDLFLGAYPLDSDDVGVLSQVGVRRVFNLTEDAEYRAGDRRSVEDALSAAGIEERRLSLPDYGGLPAAAI